METTNIQRNCLSDFVPPCYIDDPSPSACCIMATLPYAIYAAIKKIVLFVIGLFASTPADPFAHPNGPSTPRTGPVRPPETLSPNTILARIPQLDSTPDSIKVYSDILAFSPESLYAFAATDNDLSLFSNLFTFERPGSFPESLIDESDRTSCMHKIDLYRSTDPSYSEQHQSVSRSLSRLQDLLFQLRERAIANPMEEEAYKTLVKECVAKILAPGCIDQLLAQVEECLIQAAAGLAQMPEQQLVHVMTSLALLQYEIHTLNQIILSKVPNTYAHVADLQRAILALFDQDHGNRCPSSRSAGAQYGCFPSYDSVRFPYSNKEEFYQNCVLPEFNRLFNPANFLIDVEGPASSFSMHSTAKQLYLFMFRWFQKRLPDFHPNSTDPNPETAKILMRPEDRPGYGDDSDFMMNAARFGRNAALFFFQQNDVIKVL